MRDHRDVPLEVLREFARSQAEATSIRAVAEEVGIGRSTLNKFVLGRTNPQPRVRRLLALWYLETVDRAHDIDVARPYASALHVLLADLPPDQREAAARGLVNVLVRVYGEAVPRWLDLLRKRSDATRR